MKNSTSLRRALSVLLVCVIAWTPMVSVAGLLCAGTAVQVGAHDHHTAPGKVTEQSHHIHVCHSVCAACALLSSSLPMLQLNSARQIDALVTVNLPSLKLPVQERPPRFI